MAVYELLIGSSVRLDVSVKTPEGDPDDTLGLRLRIQLPSGEWRESPDELTVETDDAAGTAWCIFRPSEVGVHAYRWWFPEFPGGAVEGLFTVRPSVLTEA